MMTPREELQKEIDELLLKVLSEMVSCAKEKIIKGEKLSIDNVILLALLSQHNRITNLRKTVN